MAALRVTSPLMEKIKLQQKEDPELMKMKKAIEEGKSKEFSTNEYVIWYQNRLCVPKTVNLRKELLIEARDSTFTTHGESTKMYHHLKMHFWLIGMKKDIANYVTRCLTYEKVKTKHQKPRELLQSLPILV